MRISRPALTPSKPGLRNILNPLAFSTFRPYNKCVEITFDLAKNAANIAKHGMSLDMANSFEWDTALIEPDGRRDYGEARMLGIGYVGDRLHFVVFVKRDGGNRVISLRKASNREKQAYAQT